MTDRARVLLVGDQENLLDGLRRQFGSVYDVPFAIPLTGESQPAS